MSQHYGQPSAVSRSTGTVQAAPLIQKHQPAELADCPLILRFLRLTIRLALSAGLQVVKTSQDIAILGCQVQSEPDQGQGGDSGPARPRSHTRTADTWLLAGVRGVNDWRLRVSPAPDPLDCSYSKQRSGKTDARSPAVGAQSRSHDKQDDSYDHIRADPPTRRGAPAVHDPIVGKQPHLTSPRIPPFAA